MRFMMLMIPGTSYEDADTVPSAEMAAAMTDMMKYNQSLQQAGVLLAVDGLHSPAMGARVSFPQGKGKAVITDGPFSEAKEVLGGYWVIQVKSKAEALEWAKRCPARAGDVIEVRAVQEVSDFPEALQKVLATAAP